MEPLRAERLPVYWEPPPKFRDRVWVHVLLWGILTPLLAFFLLRVLKATLIALQFKHKAEQSRFASD